MPERPPLAPDSLDRFVDAASRVLELTGVAVITVGAAVATAAFIGRVLHRAASGRAYRRFRARLGRSILLGLEFLVAADIIRTVAVDPTFARVGVLALIVLVRTFLSFALEVEIEGRWPWESERASDDPASRI